MEGVVSDWLSILLATVTAFVVGGIWYGPLFGKAWMSALNIGEQDIRNRNMPRVFASAFLLSLIAAINLDMFIGPEAGMGLAAAAGFAAGFGWVGVFLGILYLFENRSLKAWAINAGYCTTALTTMGLVLGIW